MDLYNKKILLVIHQGNLGGAERQGLGISKILTTKYNCTVNVLLTYSPETTSEFEQFAKECQVQNILHFEDGYLLLKREFSYKNLQRLVWSVKYLLRLRKGIKPYQPDIIIPFLNFPSKVSYYLYKMLPSVQFTFWHQLGLDSNSLDIFESIAVNNIPCVIGNASNCLDMFKNIYTVNPEKLFVLPQYISLEYIEADKDLLRMKYSIPKESLVIGMIAHYREEKYHDLVLDVFNKLAIKYDTIYLVFLGNIENQIYAQEKYSQLSKHILENKTSNRISLLSGFKVQDILGLLDIGVLMSRIEGMPNAVMEYMLYGLPVVTTNHPGCIELLKDSSFLIENNETLLYDALEKLIISEELRVSEGILNLNKIKSYDMDSYLIKMNHIINEALKI
ncbi:glycosyltransferase family 4 protein [Flavobacterium sp. CAN_S2]|uniref:glycosyltransferase family 4 protein n=1 Tax=Flavobacterium sp. CAN_S2 TaxID=2787726 RepID=UPI0018CB4583